MPPRHGKSLLTSQWFPAWYLNHFPDHKVLLASYGASFAATWGSNARGVIQEHSGLLRINAPAGRAEHWQVANGTGFMATAGIGGPLTGKGANLLIIDDPVKNSAEANSEVIRESHKEWYRSTAYTRLDDRDAVVVIIQTRWHEDDLAGWQIREHGDQWTILNLPAIAEKDEQFDGWSRKEGDALWPERFNRRDLDEIKNVSGAYWWASMYQQRPAPLEGGLFKRQWFKYFNIDTDETGDVYVLDGGRLVKVSDCWRIMTVDLAVSEKTTADYTVILTADVTPTGDILVLSVDRERKEAPDSRRAIINAYGRWSPSFIGVESVAFQLSMVQELRREGLAVKKLKPRGDKVSRASNASVRYEAGTIYHRRGAYWLPTLEDELLGFPNAKHDDQVDALSYAANEVGRRHSLSNANDELVGDLRRRLGDDE